MHQTSINFVLGLIRMGWGKAKGGGGGGEER